MSGPHAGDKVRWNGQQWFVFRIDGETAELAPVVIRPRVPVSSLYVLPKPVYVNHDTTEMKPGDVWRVTVEDNPEDRSTAAVDVDGESYWLGRGGLQTRYSGPKRLLVRDGQVVQP